MSSWSKKIRRLGALLTASVLVTPLTLSAGTASAAPARQNAPHPGPSAHGQPSRYAGSYRNPLPLNLPDGGRAESCADPFVMHGAQAGDNHWYLYCTSDALTAAERGSDGKPLIHNLPTFSSTDLVNWKYAGDAFGTKPAWIKADAGMWAPDVVFRGGKYLLYYTASDTSLPGGGSAIGVATSASPTGPWTDSGRPVIEPQPRPGVDDPNDRRWVFDPEVITAGGHTYMYFGSYVGGISVRELSANGLTSLPATQRQITIDNRYEGTFIIAHDGWYYLMASATNCCAGPLTGYSVFAARSRSPLGPFVDRDGVSVLAGRVGGTPMLTQNGNRWVGAGHNAVITDFNGQDWTFYHAVDRNDPYYAGAVGYTKRPVLLDPLDFKHGWPVVRGGDGPSDTRMPAPAAQPGQRTAYKPRFDPKPVAGRPFRALSDDFSGSTLSSQWSWIRPPAAGTVTVSGGELNWRTQAADLHPGTVQASVLTEPAPDSDFVVETRVAVNVPAEGCCQNYVQGGVVIYNSDNQYVKLASASIWNTRQTEFGKEQAPAPAGFPDYGNGVVGPVGDSTYLRIVAHRGARESAYTAYTSLDGHHWDKGDTWTQPTSNSTKIGLISMGGAGFVSSFDYVTVRALVRD